MASKVFFTDLHCRPGDSQLQKLERLILRAGIGDMDFQDKYVAVKVHFGEWGNMAFLRQQYAKVVCDYIKSRGGKPFLTDCNTLYVGGRKNALDHMLTAEMNGFSYVSTGCQVIIGDGLKGSDDIEVPVEGGEYVKTAKIGRAVMDADVFISLSHFKGHEGTGFGGALKNIGMGCGSRRGKMEMHVSGKPRVAEKDCIGCGMCSKICAHGAPVIKDRKCTIDHEKCVGCGRCIAVCPKDAIHEGTSHSNEILNCRMMEYAKAVVTGRPCFHVSIAIDISPNCDCHGENDMPIIPNIGLFASFDPVALDQACADAANRMPVNPNSMLSEAEHCHHDHFDDIHPDTSWKQGLEYAEKIGLGSREYTLIEVK